MTQPRFIKGAQIRSIEHLTHILRQRKPVYIRDKIQNAAWLLNNSLGMLIHSVDQGVFYIAIEIKPRKQNNERHDED